MESNELTEEQRARIEENRQRALVRLDESRRRRGIVDDVSLGPVLPLRNISNMQRDATVGGASSACLGAAPTDVPSCSTGGPAYRTLVQFDVCGPDTCRVTMRPLHLDLVQALKCIPSRRCDIAKGEWIIAIEQYQETLAAVQRYPGADVRPLPSIVRTAFLMKRPPGPAAVNLSTVDARLVQALLPFQREGVEFAIRRGGRVLLADDMGLGKSVQALCIAAYYRIEWPLLIVCPSSMRFTWAQQVVHWLPSLDAERDITVVVTGTESITHRLITIISYELATKLATSLRNRHFQMVIVDESHLLKGHKTLRTKAIMPILKSASRRLLLTGTPALSRPIELFTQIQAVEPRLFPSYHEYAMRYCNARQTGHVVRDGDRRGGTVLRELHARSTDHHRPGWTADSAGTTRVRRIWRS